MFRNDLIRRLEKIFQMPVTLNAYSDEFEQDRIFVEIDAARPRVTAGFQRARVNGTLVVFSQDNKFPFGYMIKQIEKAAGDIKAPLFFFDIDVDRPDSQARMQNIHERRTSFIFQYDSQYDPDHGSMTELDVDINFEV